MFPHPVLRRKVAEVKKLDKKTLSEINKLKEILQKSENGAGLAATQIGVSKSFLGMKERNGVRVLINPKLVAYFGEKVYPKMVDEKGQESDFLEGCLSFPDLYGTVKRYLKIEAQWRKLKIRNWKVKTRFWKVLRRFCGNMNMIIYWVFCLWIILKGMGVSFIYGKKVRIRRWWI